MLVVMSTASRETERELDVLDTPEAGPAAVRSGALRSGAFAAGILLSLISVPLLIRHLGRDTYGVFVAITAVITIVAGVSDIGITSVGVREWAVRGAHERRDLLSTLFGARLAMVTVGCGCAMAFGAASGYDTTRLEGLAAACLGLIVLASYEAFAMPLQAELRQGWVAVAEIARQLVQVGLTVVLIAVGAGLVPLLGASIPAAVVAAAFAVRGSRQGFVRPALHPRAWWSLMHDTMLFAMASALSVVYLRTTMIITSLIASSAQTGYFAPAFRVMEVLIGVPVLLLGGLLPVLARAAATDRERLRAAIARTLEGALACGALVALCVAAGAPLAVGVLVGETPAPTVDALTLLGVGLAFSFVGASNQFTLLAMREHRAILVINVVALLVNATLTLVLVPAHGARGAGLALALSEATVATLSTVMLAQSLRGFAPSRSTLLRIALATALGAAAALALRSVGNLAELAGAATVGIGTAAALGVLPSELWGLVPRRLRPRSMRAVTPDPLAGSQPRAAGEEGR